MRDLTPSEPITEAPPDEVPLAEVLARHPEAVMVTDATLDAPGPRIVYTNAAHAAMTGFSLAALRGQSPRVMQTEETDPGELARLRAGLERGEPVRSLLLNRRADGSRIWIHADTQPLRRGDGTITHHVSVQRDVTDEVSRDALRAAVGHAGRNVLLLADAEGTLHHLSRGARSFLGDWPAGETALADLVHPEDRQAASAVLRAPRDHDGEAQRLRLRRADGAWRWVELAVHDGRDDPALRGIALGARDITGQERTRRALEHKDQQLRLALDAADLGVWWADLATATLHLDARARALLGLPDEAPTPSVEGSLELIHPEDREHVRRALRDALEHDVGYERTFRVPLDSGAVRWLLVRARVDGDHRHQRRTLTGVLMDLTDRVTRGEQLTRTLDSITDAYLALDHEGRFTFLNASAEQLLGRTREELHATPFREAFPETVGTRLDTAIRKALEGHHSAFDYHHPRPGCERWYHVRVFTSEEGVAASFHDATERVQARQQLDGLLASERHARATAEAARAELAFLAEHDDLTLLHNRRALEQRLADALDHGERVGLVLLDLDGLKLVNDTLGHETGDQVLQTVAERLRQQEGQTRALARFDGDEFAVLVDDDDGQASLAFAHAVQERLTAPLEVGDGRVALSASVGVAHAGQGQDAATLLRQADSALYTAKGSGRGALTAFDERLHEAVRERFELERDLVETKDGSQMVLHHQPIFDLGDGALAGSEALLRWQHPTRGLLGPGAFIELAEETGLIVPIGAWVITETCRLLGATHGQDGPVAWVNVAAPQLLGSDLATTILDALAHHGVAPQRLGVEITERTVLDHDKAVRAQLERLRHHGVRIALDDFGTGYSSMAALQGFPLDVLKIDRQFIAQLHTSQGRAIVETIVRLAHALGATASGEGIERAEQHRALRALGCDTGAGYLLGAPQPQLHPALRRSQAA